ncbi:hypothetical protein [Saccharibacillus brassicae]|uniref:DUF2213 domain-containing protein n=1 Tax=Saccharibacillus brassicae TaxID=2583377 RepID=A0A4Y6V093_SACBS|nr:hypothetical protein [Saccharibacillus brassicae]QDH23462.1 hypothetical protein FFV09_22905 [Saccharibacillus brassicae]
MANPTPEQLTKINQLALVPLTEDKAHVFQAKIIGTKRIEKYKMKITPNFLRKMLDQVREGVALLIDHPWMKWEALSFPYGRTFDGRIVEENGEMELYGDHYMAKGQEIAGISTDQIALGIDSGTIFDTSAGFVSTKHTCSICGGNYYGGSECQHVRGQSYDGKECLVLADDGYLMENSLVFDGGYEGAGVARAALSLQGEEQAETQNIDQYDPLPLDAKSLDGDERVFYFFSNKGGLSAFIPKHQTPQTKEEPANTLDKGDDSTVTSEEQQKQAAALAAAKNQLGRIRDQLGLAEDADVMAHLKSLTAKAADGETYKEKLIDQACGAGVRALGEAFDVDTMKLSFSALSVEQIEKIGSSYEKQAQAALGGGGRQTQGENLEVPAGLAGAGAPGNPQADAQQTPEEQAAAAKALAKQEARGALQRTGRGNLMKEDK